MPPSNEEQAAAFTAYGRVEERTAEVKDEDGTPPSPAELKAIWNDRERLRDWTWGMVRATTDIPYCCEGHIRADEESKRKWLRWLVEADPRRFARLLKRRPDLVPFTQKRQVGRPRGRANKPGLAEAWKMNQYIHSKWKEIFGHRHRKGIAGMALEIAAGVYGFTAQQLKDYNRNRH